MFLFLKERQNKNCEDMSFNLLWSLDVFIHVIDKGDKYTMQLFQSPMELRCFYSNLYCAFVSILAVSFNFLWSLDVFIRALLLSCNLTLFCFNLLWSLDVFILSFSSCTSRIYACFNLLWSLDVFIPSIGNLKKLIHKVSISYGA